MNSFSAAEDDTVADLDVDIIARVTRTSLMWRWQSEQNVLRLEITVNDAVSSQQQETSRDAVRRAARRRQWKPAVTSSLQRLV